MPFTCCVVNCSVRGESGGTKLHRFPQDWELFKIWARAIGHPEFCERNLAVVRRNYRVCDRHFDEESKFLQSRNRTNLKVGSIPTLYLPEDHSVSEILEVDRPGPSSASEPDVLETRILSDVCSASDTQGVEISCKDRRGTLHKRTPKLKRNLLREVDVRKKSLLTPRAAKLYDIAKEYRNIAKRLKYEVEGNRNRIKEAIKFAETGAVFQNKINSTTYQFLLSQISEQRKKPKGRRFSFEDKLLSLALLKQSPRGYRLLQKIFALPSRKTLMSLLRKIPFKSGINKAIFDSLTESAEHLKPINRHCILMFDEMALQPLLSYNKTEEFIDGFQDVDAEHQSTRIADHVMVFMIKGIASKWKQPVAYFFSQNGMRNAEIAKNVKETIEKLTSAGFIVDATVCDQYNKPAINMLVEQTKQEVARSGGRHDTYTFKVGEEEIIPLFDFPHLLKGLRNNMLKYDVRFRWKNGEEIASWRHIEQLYDIDVSETDSDFRMLSRLTDVHVRRDKIKKMKVKHASQVFSHRVGSTMRGLAIHGNNVLPPEAIGTSNFLLFVDKLFDSVNGSLLQPKDGKTLRCAVAPTTEHEAFWDEAIQVLRSVKYFSEGKEFVPPSVTNWILSLRNVKVLWHKLQQNGFNFLCTRNLNQDPLENFFSVVRSHGARNINPSCNSFRATFKSLIVNNFLSSHSPNANCEEDETEGILNGLKHFLHSENNELHEETSGLVPLNYGDDKLISLRPVKGSQILNVYGYITGSLAKNLLKTIGVCKTCRMELKTDVVSEEHSLIQDREYKPNTLLKPRSKFTVLFGLCDQVLKKYLPVLCQETKLRSKLYLILEKNIDSSIFNRCENHNLFKMFLNKFVDLYCFMWVTNINRILNGTMSVNNTNDPIKVQAKKLYLKYRSKKDVLRRTKHLQ